MTRALMIAAPRSNSGKTTVTLGLLAALRARGVKVRAAKIGPDYIDGGFHQAASGAPSVNLDGWAMPPGPLRALAAGSPDHRDPDALLLVEAAMGLFDGAGAPGPGGGDGSAASVARALDLPVLLVLDVAGQAQSAAATAFGFVRFDPTVAVVAVLLNRVAGARHRTRVEAAMAATGLPVVGALAREDLLALPERHLGLVGAGEHRTLDAHLATLGNAVARAVDLDAVLALARPLASTPPPDLPDPALPPPGDRIALAADPAFAFTYPHLLDAWHRAGATIVPFSPLADEAPDDDADAVWLPGGYPELHAGRLAANSRFRAGVRNAAARGAPVHGECGGFMVLGRALVDADGVSHEMLDLLDHVTSFARRRVTLGYRTAHLLHPSALGPTGTVIAGHEFHHATLVDRGTDDALLRLFDGDGAPLGHEGGRRGRVGGTFFHAVMQVRERGSRPGARQGPARDPGQSP